MKLERERALDHTRDLVAAAWSGFDQARDVEPPISTELLDTLDLSLPEAGIDVVAALDEAAEALDQSLAQARPRYLAYIGSSGLEIGALADLLAHSYDPNLALHAGAATLIEAQALRWTAEFVGYPLAGGSFTSGGTVSNVTALAAARETLDVIHAARAEGLSVNGQVGSRAIGVLIVLAVILAIAVAEIRKRFFENPPSQ